MIYIWYIYIYGIYIYIYDIYIYMICIYGIYIWYIYIYILSYIYIWYIYIYMIYIYIYIYLWYIYIYIHNLYNHTCWDYIPTNGDEVITQPSINRDSPESAPPNPRFSRDFSQWNPGLPGLPRYVELLEARMLQDGTSHSHVARRMQGAAVAFRWLFSLTGAKTAYYSIISDLPYNYKN